MEITAKQLAEEFKLVVDEFDVENVAAAGARRIKYLNLKASGLSVKQARKAMIDALPTAGDLVVAQDALGRGMNFQQAVNFVVYG
jgi:hypothetical protein